MFVKQPGETDTPFALALRCASSMLQDKIISSDSDLLGIMLYATDKKRNVSGFDNIYVLQELDVPSAERILELEDIIAGRTSIVQLCGHLKPNVAPNIGNVLWVASMIFGNSAVKVGSKRVFLFTNEDDPLRNDAVARDLAKTRAKDLADLGIEVELFSISKPGSGFNFETFFIDIRRVDDDDASSRFPTAAEHFEQLMERVRRKEYKKRTMLRLSMHLTGTMEIGVRLYNMISEAKRGGYVWLDSRQNEEVRPSTRYVTDVGEVVSVKDMKSYYVFGGEKVVFDREELEQARDYGAPGLFLMGFKPRSALKRKHALKHALFVYPNDGDVSGSSVVFHALLARLGAQDKVAIMRFVPRSNSAPRFVALIPQQERFDADGVQVAPPGFHLVFLPFSDDLRKLAKPEEVVRAPTELVDRARRVVEKLELKDFSPSDYENPVLKRHYANLQALALNQDVPEDFADHTLPKVDAMLKRVGGELADIKKAVFPDGYVQLSATAKGGAARRPAKRAAGDEAAAPAKKVKEENEEISLESLKKMNAAGTVRLFLLCLFY